MNSLPNGNITPPQQTETNKQQQNISEQMIGRIWQRLSECYGTAWENSYGVVGGVTFKSWAEALAQFSPEQLMRGLQAVIQEGSDFPPNLIKFIRLCRTAPPEAHRSIPAALPQPKPRYSVMRIEQAKQKLLTGRAFKIPSASKTKHVIDWNREDEEELCSLLAQWDENTGHEGLNALIDGHQFSHGKQEDNAYA